MLWLVKVGRDAPAAGGLAEVTETMIKALIAKAGRPLAKLVPLAAPPASATPGGWEGKVRIAEDFDAPLPEAAIDAFEGKA